MERAVVDAARCGVWAEPDIEAGVEDLAVTEDAGLRVQAELIRELLMGRRGELDPRGLRVRGVRVVGQLDLDHIPAVSGLSLINCALPDGIACRYARIREINLSDSLVSALSAEGLRTDGHLFLRDATMRGADERGTVRLYGAYIGGQLDLDGIEVSNDTGPALDADRLRTDNELFLRNAIMRGAGEAGTVRLPGAHIGGQVHMAGTQLSNDSGPLLSLSEAQLEGALFLPATVVCPTGSTDVSRCCTDDGRQMTVGGLVFPRLRDVSWQQWLHLLVHHTPQYSPQPYQQLAAVERAAGHDTNARHVLITQQEDLRRRTPEALGGRIGQWRHWLWGLLGRYGYRAYRLVTALAFVLALTAGLGYAAGQISTRPGHHAAERVPPPTATTITPGTPCSSAELIGLGIDRGLPLGATGLRVRCDLDTGTRWGQAFTYAIWVLQGLVWALATLAIAAYTGLVRKPT